MDHPSESRSAIGAETAPSSPVSAATADTVVVDTVPVDTDPAAATRVEHTVPARAVAVPDSAAPDSAAPGSAAPGSAPPETVLSPEAAPPDAVPSPGAALPGAGSVDEALSAEAADGHAARMRQLDREQRAKVQAKTVRRGVVLVNTGDGKGKSTAAFGLALRAAGSGLRVGLVQFIKGTWKTGEAEALRRFPEIEHIVSGEGFTWKTQDRQRDVDAARRGWNEALRIIEASRAEPDAYRLLILDEVNVVLHQGTLPLGEVLAALRGKPLDLSIVLTGRGAPQELIAAADTVTEMRMVKHAFEAGIRAQRGIEF